MSDDFRAQGEPAAAHDHARPEAARVQRVREIVRANREFKAPRGVLRQWRTQRAGMRRVWPTVPEAGAAGKAPRAGPPGKGPPVRALWPGLRVQARAQPSRAGSRGQVPVWPLPAAVCHGEGTAEPRAPPPLGSVGHRAGAGQSGQEERSGGAAKGAEGARAKEQTQSVYWVGTFAGQGEGWERRQGGCDRGKTGQRGESND
uniref:(northern house mosquito) hypothetical protein n=1 Tax=Culex pipiens TaxID=7175 RepID=A0A8D8KJ02_CULPI